MEMILGLSSIIGAIISFALYAMQAIGLQSIAKNRGISCPWLAWIPIGNSWIIGAISDHYQEATCGKARNKRLWLTIFSILIIGLSVWVIGDFFAMAANQVAPTSDVLSMLAYLGIICVLLIIYDVVLYVALYHTYKSCDPSTAAIFLILSIFISGISSILLFVQRNKKEI